MAATGLCEIHGLAWAQVAQQRVFPLLTRTLRIAPDAPLGDMLLLRRGHPRGGGSVGGASGVDGADETASEPGAVGVGVES